MIPRLQSWKYSLSGLSPAVCEIFLSALISSLIPVAALATTTSQMKDTLAKAHGVSLRDHQDNCT